MAFVDHRFYLNDYAQDHLQSLIPQFGFNGYGEIIYYRTYSRIMNDSSQEHWADTVIRVIEGCMSIRKDFYKKNRITWEEAYWQEYANEMALALYNMKWFPGGRGLWAMGTDFVYERGSMALYNCAFTNIFSETISDDLAWLMDSLMNGCGVGFAPIRDKLKIYSPSYTVSDFIIPDTREGWVESIRALIDSYIVRDSNTLRFIYDYIRAAGEPIKGFGGISSGPDSLRKLHEQIRQQFENYKDVVLLKTNLANLIGCCVVAGNVRRSAEIAVGTMDDELFLDLKDYEKYPERASFGWMSNNSPSLLTEEDFDKLGEIAERVKTRGEPGIRNQLNVQYGRIGKKMRKYNLRKDDAEGLNPCLHSKSKLLTPNGIRQLGQLSEGNVIWSECGWTKIIKKWSTGVNKVYKYTTTAGIFYGTENHQIVTDGLKIQIKDAFSIDIIQGPIAEKIDYNPRAIMDGLLIGDGSVKNEHNSKKIVLYIGQNDQDYFNSEISHLIFGAYDKNIYKVNCSLQYEDVPKTFLRKVPDKYLYGNIQEVISFLRGLYSANGSICGGRVTLKASSFKIIEDVQMMLSSIGIKSYWTKNKETVVTFRNGDYTCKESYDLQINEGKYYFYNLIGFLQKYKMNILKEVIEQDKHKKSNYKNNFQIISREFISEEETFDITVDNIKHTFWNQCCNVSNCGEINLHHREVCNLAETIPTNCIKLDEWKKACEYATVYCTTVSMLPTHHPSTNRIVAKNRRIGVGIMDFTGWKHENGVHKVTKWMREGYDLIVNKAKELNAEAGIPAPIRHTCIKPGGTTPKLVGKTSGISYPTFRHTLRTTRIQRNSPIHAILVKANIPYHEATFEDNTDIFEYPILQGPAKPAEEVSLWEQASNLVLMQREWADNAVSNTLYFKPMWQLCCIENIQTYPNHVNQYIIDNLGISVWRDIIDDRKKEYIIPEKLKLVFTWGKNELDELVIIEVKTYDYDPKHEENDIEAVLSSIVPLIKSVSLIPHTPKGVYKDMPEQGISEVEYHERLRKIKRIDFSTFRGSDGQDEKYCTGDQCEIPLKT